jgi:hypothetical protein
MWAKRFMCFWSGRNIIDYVGGHGDCIGSSGFSAYSHSKAM